MIPAFPLQWPTGWKRTHVAQRVHGKFGKRRTSSGSSYAQLHDVTINEAVERVRDELQRMGVDSDDLVISTNVKTRLDGFPRSDQRAPEDPGAAVYWTDKTQPGAPPRCMAIDRYQKVADNLAAIAATLDAMRAIERHGGAEVLDRAFTGFVALPPPDADWAAVLGVAGHASTNEVRDAYRALRSQHHPDNGGDANRFNQINTAWKAVCRQRGIDR